MLVAPEDAQKSNIAPDRLKLDERYGGPGYIAVFEVMHQLHCLVRHTSYYDTVCNVLIVLEQDMLRKASYYNYEYYVNEGRGAFKNPEKQLKFHLGKRTSVVMQKLSASHPFR